MSQTEPKSRIDNKGAIVGFTFISIATLIWGFSHVITKYALEYVEPFALTFIRVAVTTVFFLLTLVIAKARLLELVKHWRTFLPLGITGITVSQLLWVVGLQHTTPSHSAFIFALVPISTALLASLILKEKVSLWRKLGIGVSFIGAGVLATEGGFELTSRYLLGDLAVIIAVLSFALFTVLSKPVVARFGSHKTVAMTYLFALPVTALFTLIPALQQPWHKVTLSGWSAVAFLVFFATIITSQAFQHSLKHLKSTTVAGFVYLQPVIGTLVSVCVGYDQITPNLITAAALIFLGLLLFRY